MLDVPKRSYLSSVVAHRIQIGFVCKITLMLEESISREGRETGVESNGMIAKALFQRL